MRVRIVYERATWAGRIVGWSAHYSDDPDKRAWGYTRRSALRWLRSMWGERG